MGGAVLPTACLRPKGLAPLAYGAGAAAASAAVTRRRRSRAEGLLLGHGHALREIPRLVNVVSTAQQRGGGAAQGWWQGAASGGCLQGAAGDRPCQRRRQRRQQQHPQGGAPRRLQLRLICEPTCPPWNVGLYICMFLTCWGWRRPGRAHHGEPRSRPAARYRSRQQAAI